VVSTITYQRVILSAAEDTRRTRPSRKSHKPDTTVRIVRGCFVELKPTYPSLEGGGPPGLEGVNS